MWKDDFFWFKRQEVMYAFDQTWNYNNISRSSGKT